MQICYNETMEHSNLEKDLELCRRIGYDSIEIRIEYLQEYLRTHDVKDLKKSLAQMKLKPLAFNSVDNINFCRASQWDAILERFLFACKMCREINNPYIVVVPTEDEHLARRHPAEIFADSVDVLRTLSGIAAPYGAKLAFEPIGNPRWCVRSIHQAAEIVKAVNRNNVGLTIDAMNLYCYAGFKDMEDLRKIPKGKVYVFHINDAMDHIPLEELEPEKHRLYPGDGVIPLKEFCQILLETGFDGPASLELFNPDYSKMEPEAILEEGYIKTKALLASLEV